MKIKNKTYTYFIARRPFGEISIGYIKDGNLMIILSDGFHFKLTYTPASYNRKIEMEIDPESAYNNHEIFYEIFKEKLKNEKNKENI